MNRFFQMRKRTHRERILFSWPVVIIVVSITAYIGWYTFRSYQNYREVENEYKELQARKDELTARIQDMQDSLALLESDEGRERVIRERLDVQKEGEQAVIFPKEEELPQEFNSAFHSFTSFFKDLFGF